MSDGAIPTWDDTEAVSGDDAEAVSWDDTSPVETSSDPTNIRSATKDVMQTATAANPMAVLGGIGAANIAYVKDAFTGENKDKPITEYLKDGYQTGQDATQGALQGFTFGGADELAGGIGAGVAKITGDERHIRELYRQSQLGAQDANDEAKANSPTANMIGEIGGNIALSAAVPSFGIASKANKILGTADKAGMLGKLGVKSVSEALKLGKGKELLSLLGKNAGKAGLAFGAEAAALGAVQGGLSSKGELGSDEMIDDSVKAGTLGLAVGAGLGAGGHSVPMVGELGLTKFDQKLASMANSDSARTRKMYEAYKRTRGGLPKLDSNSKISSETVNDDMAANTTEFTNRFLKAENEAGNALETTITQATDNGVLIPLNDTLEQTATEVQILAKRRHDIEFDPEYGKLMEKIFLLKSDKLTPSAANALKGDLRNFASKLKDPEIMGTAQRFASGIKESMEGSVPGFKEANSKFSMLRENGRETLMGRGTNPEFNDTWISDVKNSKSRTESDVRSMFDALSAPGSGPVQEKAARQSKYLLEQLAALEKSHPGSLKQLGYDSIDAVQKDIMKKSDLVSLNRAVNGARLNTDEVALSANPVKMAQSAIKAGFGEAAQYNLGQTAGKAMRGLEVRFNGVPSYNAPGVDVSKYADELLASGSRADAMHGKALKDAIQNNDNTKKNATLFVLQQLRRRMSDDNE